MCVAAIAWQAHPRWRLVAIGNRDEYHDRPALPLARWTDGSGVLAGRDQRSDGTWLGLSEEGRFSLVTNRRGFESADPAKTSRGALVTDTLAGADPAGIDLHRYNPFNLFTADSRAAFFLTNRPDPIAAPLMPGIYGLSNGSLDEPWPKTLFLKAAVIDWLQRAGTDISPLLATLRSEALPEAGIHTRQPSDVPVEPADTPPFILDAADGTRCSTVILIDSDGAGRVFERSFTADGEEAGDVDLRFAWPRATSDA